MTTLFLEKEDCYRGPLILVNKSHPLRGAGRPRQNVREEESVGPLRAQEVNRPESADAKDGGLHGKWPDEGIVPVDETCPEIGLDSQAARIYRKALEELGCVGGVVPVSGYRTRAEQEAIYRDSLEENGAEFTKKYVALPDCSEHQTGLAIDLGEGGIPLDFIRPSFPDSGACGRFKRAAARYGFILRYPAGKESVTGIAHEPWHFRYVGYPHSRIMEEREMVLEEYLEYLAKQAKDWLVWETGGRFIEIRYITAEEPVTKVEIPDGCLYQISGDNRNGFVVTVWRER